MSTKVVAFGFTAADARALTQIRRHLQQRSLAPVTQIGALRHALQVALAAEGKGKR